MTDDAQKANFHDRANDVIERLVGTCMSLAEGLGDDEETPELLEAIDDELFECEGCGWWCRRGEEESETEGYCTDCVNEEA